MLTDTAHLGIEILSRGVPLKEYSLSKGTFVAIPPEESCDLHVCSTTDNTYWVMVYVAEGPLDIGKILHAFVIGGFKEHTVNLGEVKSGSRIRVEFHKTSSRPSPRTRTYPLHSQLHEVIGWISLDVNDKPSYTLVLIHDPDNASIGQKQQEELSRKKLAACRQGNYGSALASY